MQPNQHSLHQFRNCAPVEGNRRRAWGLLASFAATVTTVSVVSHSVANETAMLDLDAATVQVANDFDTHVQPLLQKYCIDCHSGDDPAAKLDVEEFSKSESVVSRWHTWQAMLSRTEEGEMPPVDYGQSPTPEEIQTIANWTVLFRDTEAHKNAGDPGPNSTRRLNNAEYNYSIRDLTGVDIRPTSSFPIDAANAAGFDNSAESLTLSPALITKYLDAAKQVAEHMVLTPIGIEFSAFPVVTDTDRDKYSVQRIIDFYKSKPTKIERYLFAAWEIQRSAKEDIAAAINNTANSHSISPKYLEVVYEYLTQAQQQYGPGKQLQQDWNALVENESDPVQALEKCKTLAEGVSKSRKSLRPQVSVMRGPNGMGVGSQPVILKRNAIVAANRRTVASIALDPTSELCQLTDDERQIMIDGTQEEKEQVRTDYATFCSVFPDAFVILERGRAYLSEEEAAKEARGRLLSAGFHSMTGFFRDDQPLCELILTEDEKKQLDQLWEHFFFSSNVHHRHFAGFLWYERAESTFINEPAFDFIRAEDKDATSDEKLARFREAYKSKVSRGQKDATAVLAAIDEYFDAAKTNLAKFNQQYEASKSKHLDALVDFAERAYRKPLTDLERADIQEFYRESLQLPLADHRTAVEDTLISILMSPKFFYRWDLQSPIATNLDQENPAVKKIGNRSDAERIELEDHELASRLSYFLWCSQPDAELRELASLNKLSEPATLQQQTRRLLSDDKASDMLLEFMGNWLEFRRFDQHNAVDREQFPTFTDDVRQSMAEEPIQLLRHIIQTGGKVTDLIQADYVIVDQNLAKFYGIDEYDRNSPRRWQKIEDASRFHRGGMLPMGLFLTQNSPGLRTSPVKRGYWVIRRLLGEHIPPPPPDVPELPSSETQLGELTVREALAKHREHASCAACHKRFDFAGVLLEAFDPIGQPRQVDLGGRAISTNVELPNGEEVDGVDGLKRYIVEDRLDDFRRHICERLAAFALNRSLIIPDTLLIDSMVQALKDNDDSFAAAVECLVSSPQFLSKRVLQATGN